MSLVKKLANQTVIYGLGSILPKLLNFIILTPYLTNKFNNVEDQGLYAVHGIMYAFVGLLMALLTLRLETTLFRFGSKKGFLEKSYSTALWILIGVSIIACIVIYGLATPLAGVLTKPRDEIYVKFIAFIVALDILAALPFARLRLKGKPFKFSFIKIANVVITIIVLLFFLEFLPSTAESGTDWAENFYDKDHRLAYVFLANLVGSVCVVLMLIPEFLKLTRQFDRALSKKMVHYAWPLIIVGIAGIINMYSDRWLLNTLLPGNLQENEIQTGIYNACAKIAILMSLFTTAFNYAAEPFFFKQSSSNKSPQLYADIARAFTFIGCLIFLGILFYIDLFQFLIGSNFREGLYIVPILLLSYLFLGLHYNFSVWYKINDKTKIGALIAIIGSIVSVAVNIVMIPKIGLMASAWASLFTFFTMAVLNITIGRKYYPVPYAIGRMAMLILSAVGLYYLSEFLHDTLQSPMSIKFGINTALLLAYIVLVYFYEQRFFRRILAS